MRQAGTIEKITQPFLIMRVMYKLQLAAAPIHYTVALYRLHNHEGVIDVCKN